MAQQITKLSKRYGPYPASFFLHSTSKANTNELLGYTQLGTVSQSDIRSFSSPTPPLLLAPLPRAYQKVIRQLV